MRIMVKKRQRKSTIGIFTEESIKEVVTIYHIETRAYLSSMHESCMNLGVQQKGWV